MLLAMQCLAEFATPKPFIGGFIYNYYFLGLMDGKVTIPAQIAGLEGFYDSEGRAFLYHGLGPLVTRALAWPFVDLTTFDLRPVTIWLFATIGSATFYLTALSVLGRSMPRDAGSSWSVHVLIWLMVWVLAPGIVLSGNGSFFHEPIAFAFAMVGCGTYCLLRLVQVDFADWRWLLALSVVAGLAVHGRPHIAIGLYGATVLAAGLVLWRLRGRALIPASAAMLILLVLGLAFLQMNELRFGSIAQYSGTVSDEGAVYGFRYWGWEPPNTPRFLSNETHGQFNAGRILPNLLLYGFSMGGETSIALFRKATADLGYIRIESPVIGFVLLWLPWCIFAVSAFLRRSGPSSFLFLGLVAAVPGALVMLAYTTVTMRYRIELWPVLFVPAVMALAAILEKSRDDPEALRRVLFSLKVAVVAGAGIGLLNLYVYLDQLNWEWGSAMRSFEDCARMVAEHPDLGPTRINTICILDVPET